MTKKLNILVDMDDVLEDLLTPWVEENNKMFGTSIKRNKITDWSMTKYWPDVKEALVFSALEKQTFWEKVLPKNGAVDSMKELMDRGHDVHVVTSSWPNTIKWKAKWLDKYYPFLTWKRVIVTSEKQLVKGDVLIDDGIHNLIGCDLAKLLFDAPHNRSFNCEGTDIIRVKSWKEIMNYISRMENESEE